MAQLHVQTGSSRHVCPYDLFLSFFATSWAGLHPIFFLNIKLPLGDIDGASPTHSPKSGWECPHRWRKSLIPPDNRPNKHMPHRWRISFHPEEGICPKNRACFQTIPNHIDGASQARAWWWGQKPVSKCVCHCQPPSACWTAMFGTRMDGAMRTKFCLQMCLQMPTFLGLLRDVGRYEGLAPSMWAFPAWFWRMNRTCAIYVPLLSLWLKF